MLCQLSYVGPDAAGNINGVVVGREGIEPPQSKTADLQSAELTTCSTYPLFDCVRPQTSLMGVLDAAPR